MPISFEQSLIFYLTPGTFIFLSEQGRNKQYTIDREVSEFGECFLDQIQTIKTKIKLHIHHPDIFTGT